MAGRANVSNVPAGPADDGAYPPSNASPDEVMSDARALGDGESPGPARGPRCSSMSESKSQRPFGKSKFFIRTARGGTFQGTGETATRAASL